MKANRRARLRARGPGEAAVSDILGSILLVGITVIMATGFGLLLLSLDGPTDLQHTDLALSLDPGADGKWQGESGDLDSEQVRILHMGGEPLLATAVSVNLRVGNTTTVLTGTQLSQAYSTGTDLRLGEVWASDQSLSRNQSVSLDVVVRLPNGGGQLLTTALAVAGTQVASALCASDGTPPVAALVSQSPPDVTSLTSGSVTVTATLSDNCSGVNAAAPPQLWYCIAVSCSFPSGYTNGGSMVLANGTWSGTIPHGAWLGDLGKTLNHRLVNMTDLAGNRANSTIVSDPVNVFTTYTYVQSASATTGTVSNLPFAQNPTDSLEATFAEAPNSGGAGSMTLNASTPVSTSGNGWSGANNAVGSDDDHATNSNDGRTITVSLTDPPSNPGVISRVVVSAEVSISGANGDRFDLYACISGSCNTPVTIVGPATDALITYDVTNQRPGGGSWSWADLNDLQVRVGTNKAGAVDGTWRIDDATATIDHQPTYGLSVQANFTGVPLVGTHAVEIRHRNETGETFRVEACTLFVASCTTWTALGNLPSSGSGATTSFPLPALANSGTLAGVPKLRFLDNTSSTTPGILYLDYVRIGTT